MLNRIDDRFSDGQSNPEAGIFIKTHHASDRIGDLFDEVQIAELAPERNLQFRTSELTDLIVLLDFLAH